MKLRFSIFIITIAIIGSINLAEVAAQGKASRPRTLRHSGTNIGPPRGVVIVTNNQVAPPLRSILAAGNNGFASTDSFIIVTNGNIAPPKGRILSGSSNAHLESPQRNDGVFKGLITQVEASKQSNPSGGKSQFATGSSSNNNDGVFKGLITQVEATNHAKPIVNDAKTHQRFTGGGGQHVVTSNNNFTGGGKHLETSGNNFNGGAFQVKNEKTRPDPFLAFCFTKCSSNLSKLGGFAKGAKGKQQKVVTVNSNLTARNDLSNASKARHTSW